MKQLADAGIPVGVMTAPIIPGLNESEIPALLKAAAEAGACGAGYTMLRLPYQIKALFFDWLRREFPDRAGKVESQIRNMRNGELYHAGFFERHKGVGARAEQVGQMFRVFQRKHNLYRKWVRLSSEEFLRRKSLRESGGQLGLWSS